MAVFWSYFRDFVGAQKIEDLSKSKIFFAEVFQIASRFVLARKKKKIGVRCTLINSGWSVIRKIELTVIYHHGRQSLVDDGQKVEVVVV